MKQLTEKQAIMFAKSNIWKKWNNEQIVRFQLFQRKLCMDFSRFHQALEKVLNRSVYIHELGLNYDGIIKEYLGINPEPTLDEIINLIPKEKRLIINI